MRRIAGRRTDSLMRQSIVTTTACSLALIVVAVWTLPLLDPWLDRGPPSEPPSIDTISVIVKNWAKDHGLESILAPLADTDQLRGYQGVSRVTTEEEVAEWIDDLYIIATIKADGMTAVIRYGLIVENGEVIEWEALEGEVVYGEED